ncbi:MAG: 16S rRNA processing protein RimM [Hyphomicrobium sp.]|nr:MAG: 16S rRNA processing protein RimM [Hyphomicrobium sp.]PPD00572.1 MAG: 16S rRNA processing protein RimM [Hyphomicrobium sp.]
MNSTKQRLILLGQIASAHGIRGDVLVRTFTGSPADIASYGPLSDANGAKFYKLRVVRVTDKGIVARIDGVTDRNSAEALRGQDLYVERAKLPPANDEEFYHADLIGLTAITGDGSALGRIIAVQNFGAGDLIEIRKDDESTTELIPFTKTNVPIVDFENGRVTVVAPVMVGDPEPQEAEVHKDDGTD